MRVARELGREIASGKEAREIYRIGEFYQSTDETHLAKNGFSPNRQPGQKGFLPRHRPRAQAAEPPGGGRHP